MLNAFSKMTQVVRKIFVIKTSIAKWILTESVVEGLNAVKVHSFIGRIFSNVVPVFQRYRKIGLGDVFGDIFDNFSE